MRPSATTNLISSLRQTLYLALALLLGLFAAQLFHVAHLYSANWDEAHHLYDGYKILTERDYRANAEVPPLVKVMAALPLLHLHPALPIHAGHSQTESAFREGRAFVFGNGGDRLLLPARIMCALFPLITAVLVFAVGRRLFGAAAGLLALLLFVFDPLVLAHGTLISTDMASACFLFATVFSWYRYTEARGLLWLLTTALLAGLAMVAKFTGVLVLPILLLLVIGEAWRGKSLPALWRGLAAWVAVGLGGWLVIWAFYGFRYAPAAAGLSLAPPLAEYIASLHAKGFGQVLTLFARWRLLPEAYLWGLADTKHKEWDYVAYFVGKVWRHGPPAYFPVAFLIKSTLPFLFLLVLAPVAFRTALPKQGRAMLFLLLPVAVYFTVITTSHFDIGARHMLPIYPFLYVVAGATGVALVRRGSAWAWVVGIFAVWQVVTSVRVAPNYMAYGNEAMGGPLEVRRYLSDANVDWGQQLKTVRQYLVEHPGKNCWFAYFPDGAVEPEDYGVHCHRLPTPSALWWFRLPMEVPPQIDGTVLISESDLEGVESGDGPLLNPYEEFRHRTPKAILQDGVYVFEGSFPVKLASAWVAIQRSNELLEAGHREEALAAAVQAAQLVPQAARVQLNLADKLAAMEQWPEAMAHYQLAQHQLQEQRPDLQGDELEPAIEKGLQAATISMGTNGR